MKSRAKILVTEPIHPEAIVLLKEHFTVYEESHLSPSEIGKKIADMDGIVTRSTTAVDSKLIDQGKKLRVIARAGIGIDNIDTVYAQKRGIPVVNAPTGNALAAAEHTIGLLLALLRSIPQAHQDLHRGIWGKHKYVGVQVEGKTIGIVGYGRVGSAVAKKATGLGMNVVVCDPFVHSCPYPRLTVEELLKTVDVVSLHVPLTRLTETMLDKTALSLMQPSSFLINAARGKVVDQKALYQVLDNKTIAGAALDVFEEEPLSRDEPLLTLSNCIVTPHIAGSTREAQRATGLEVARKVIEILLSSTGMRVRKQSASATNYDQHDVIVFDCDSTLSALEGIDELARLNGVEKQVVQLTHAAMNGDLSYEEVFVKRLELSRPTKKQLEQVGKRYIECLIPDAKACIDALRYLGKRVYIVSGGYDTALEILGKHLDLPSDAIIGNRLHFDATGRYQGFDRKQALWKSRGKQNAIRKLKNNGDKVLLIGDGTTDSEAQDVVDLFVGFGGVVRREKVAQQAAVYINSPVLSPILLLATNPPEWQKLLASPYKSLVQTALSHLTSSQDVVLKNGQEATLGIWKEYFLS